MKLRSLVLTTVAALTLIWCMDSVNAEGVKIPAFTAYMLPVPESARISEAHGVTKWTDATQSVNWYGKFEATGELTASVQLRLPKGATSRLRLTVNGKAQEAMVVGNDKNEIVTAAFGAFSIGAVGYQRFQLESLNDTGEPFGDIDAMILDGPATEGVRFNLKERRNAASVHLMYPVKSGTEVEAFYSEVTAVEDPAATFYMACGWHRGYFGMQVNSPTERRIIFSVWDGGHEGVDRKKVADENRVQLLGKGDGVYSGDFGNEGTGGHIQRKALYGNQWIRTPNGEWIELTTANFSHDPTGKTDRFDRFMGVEHGEFFLSHGGFVTNQPPRDIELPKILN